jgi:hypothetical protein
VARNPVQHRRDVAPGDQTVDEVVAAIAGQVRVDEPLTSQAADVVVETEGGA